MHFTHIKPQLRVVDVTGTMQNSITPNVITIIFYLFSDFISSKHLFVIVISIGNFIY